MFTQLEEKSEIKQIVNELNLEHIAIIMDGNRRWAKEKCLPTPMGHKKGVDALKNTLKACHKFGIKYLTVYAFSTENWNRDKSEVDFLMGLLAQTIKNELLELDENKVKINFIGNLEALNPSLKQILDEAVEKTKNNKGVRLQIAFNYGSRNEITNAVKNMMADGVKAQDVSEEMISKYLYTSDIPDPDLLIRTGGEMRISNYLLWQIAYAEFIVTPTYWPDFNESSLEKAVLEFQHRNRRFGK